MMPCTRCGSRKYVKSGFEENRQRYRCKKCNYHYSVKQRKGTFPKKTKRLALDMYLEGMGLRAMAESSK